MSQYLCDTNIWLALALPTHVHHPAVRSWVDGVPDLDTLLFCRSTQQSYLRLLTTRSTLAQIGGSPLTNAEAWAAYEALLVDERVVFMPEEPARLETHWRQFAARATSSPNVWMDAYLAAFAVAGDYRFVTTDGGFRQYDGLDLLLLGSHV